MTHSRKVVPYNGIRVTQGNFPELEWDGAASWQLRAFVAITGSMLQLQGLYIRGRYGVI